MILNEFFNLPQVFEKDMEKDVQVKGQDVNVNVVIDKLKNFVSNAEQQIENADYNQQIRYATIVRDRALQALEMIAQGGNTPEAANAAFRYMQTGEQGVAEAGMYGDEEVSWEKGGRRAPTGAFRNPAAEKIDQANKILDNPNSSPDMKKAAASILGQEQMLLRQYKDTAARRKQGMAEGKAMIRKVVRELPSGGKSETYELLNDKGVTLKTGMSKETAQSALKAHKQKTLGESRLALLKQIIQS